MGTEKVNVTKLVDGDRYEDSEGFLHTVKSVNRVGKDRAKVSWYEGGSTTVSDETTYNIIVDDPEPVEKGGAAMVDGVNTTPVNLTPDNLVDWHDLGLTHQNEPTPKPEIDLPSLSEVALVDPTVYQDELIYASETKIADRIHIYRGAVDPYVGIVTEIHYDSAIGSVELVFENGTRYQCKPTDQLSRSAQNCVVQAANGHVGLITLTLRLDNDLDAQNAAKTYALYVRNQKPEITAAILHGLMNIQKN